jgi:ABC-type multidrug transport system permease subunit
MNWDHLSTILWLRWRLMNNQLRRGGGLGAVISIIMVVAASLLGTALFFGALFGGIFGLDQASPQALMSVWFGITGFFLFLWFIGLLAELQRSEAIDLQKLLHLPVALGQLFVINYLASHFTLSIILVVPVILGLGLGLAIAHGPEMLLLIPLALSMVLMITAWTYCLRGWLATMMSNPRRRRTIIMCLTFGFVLLAQGPNLYINVFLRSSANQPSLSHQEQQARLKARLATTQAVFHDLASAEDYIPPLWVPVGARALAEGHALPALLGTLGGLGLAALGLRRAYRGTLRFYHGETGGLAAAKLKTFAAAKTSSAPRDKNKKSFLERSLPFVPEQPAALALATFQSLLRAPEVKMAWASSFIVTIILGASFFFRDPANLSGAVKPFIVTGSIVFPVFFLAQFFANQFGFDRDGFRALILSPAERRFILLGKNLATLPVGATFGGLLLALASVWLHLPLPDVAATVFQLVTVQLIASLAGNLLSILNPFRIRSGTMKPTKMPGLAMLVLFLCQMLFPLAMAPVFFPQLLALLWRGMDLPDAVPVNLIFSVLLCGLIAILYWQALAPLGRLLQQRETKILGIVSVEVE